MFQLNQVGLLITNNYLFLLIYSYFSPQVSAHACNVSKDIYTFLLHLKDISFSKVQLVSKVLPHAVFSLLPSPITEMRVGLGAICLGCLLI